MNFLDSNGLTYLWNKIKDLNSSNILPVPLVDVQYALIMPVAGISFNQNQYLNYPDVSIVYKKEEEPASKEDGTILAFDSTDMISEEGNYYFRAFSSDSNYQPSQSILKSVLFRAAEPEISFNKISKEVTIDSIYNQGGRIYYTLDGSTPNTIHGETYTGPFTVSEKCNVKAIATSSNASIYSIVVSLYVDPT